MAIEEEGLHQTITADASGMEGAYSEVIDLAQKVISTHEKMGAVGAEAGTKLAEGAAKAKVELEGAGAAGEKFGREVHEGAEEGLFALRALHENAKELREVLLSFAGPVTALFALGEAFKDAVTASSTVKTTVGEISILLANQGENAGEASEELEKYATALSRASQFSDTQLLASMRNMLAAGVDLNDVIRSQAPAMELATATGRSLEEAENALIEAHNGRMRGLVALGIVTREEVKAGIDYETVLQRIEERTKGGVSAANAQLTGQLGLLKNNVDILLESLGNGMSPALATLVGDLDTVVVEVQDLTEKGGALNQVFSDLGAGIGDVVNELVNVAESGPGALAVVGGLSIVAGKLAITLGVDLAKSLATVATGLVTSTISAATFAATLTKDAIVATVAFGAALLEQAQKSIAVFLAMLSIEGPEAIGTLVAALTAGAAESVVQWAIMAAPVTLVVGALAGLVVAWQSDFGHIQEITDTVITWIVNRFGDLTRAIGGALSFLAQVADHVGAKGVGAALESAAQGVDKVGDAASKAKVHVKDLAAAASHLVKGAVDFAKGGFEHALKLPPAPPTHPSDFHIAGTAAGGPKVTGAPVDAADVERVNAVVAAEDKLKSKLQEISDSELKYKNDVSLATTVQQKYNAELALKAKIVADATQASGLLQTQLNAEDAEIKKLTAQHAEETSKLNAAAAAYNAAAASKSKDTQRTTDLKRAYDDAKKTWDETKSSLDKLNAAHKENAHLLAESQAKLVEVQAAQAALQVEFDKSTRASKEKQAEEEATYKLGIAQQIAYYQERIATVAAGSDNELAIKAQFIAKIRELETQEYKQSKDDDIERRKLADEEATYKKSLAQQVAYYQNRLDVIVRSGEDEYDEAAGLRKKILELEDQAYKQRLDNAEAFKQQVEQKEKGILDDLLVKHKSFRDELKTIYDDIKNAFVQMVEQMVLKSALFSQMPGILGTIFGGEGDAAIGGKGSKKNPLGGSIPSVLSTFMGGVAGGSSSPAGTKSDPVYVEGTPAHFAAMTGSQSGLMSGASDGFALPVAPANNGGGPTSGAFADLIASGVFGPSGGSGGLRGPGGGGTGIVGAVPAGGYGAMASRASGGSGGVGGLAGLMNQPLFGEKGLTAGGLIGAAGTGDILGGMVGGLLNNGQNNAALGGALGGAIGDVIATSSTATFASLGAAAGPLGMLAGSLIGSLAGGLFGSHDKPNLMPDKYNTQVFGTDLANLTGAWQANGTNFTESNQMLTALGGQTGLAAIAAYIKQTGGTGLSTQEISDLSNVTKLSNLHNGNLTSNTGITKFWSDWVDEANNALQTIISVGGAPSFQISRTSPDANYTLTGGSTYYPATSSGQPSPGGIRKSQAVVYNDFTNATIVGPGGLDQAAVTIGQSLNRVANGQVAGAPSTSLSNPTFAGDF